MKKLSMLFRLRFATARLVALCSLLFLLAACGSSSKEPQDSNNTQVENNSGPKVRPTAGVGVGVGSGGFRGIGGGVGIRI